MSRNYINRERGVKWAVLQENILVKDNHVHHIGFGINNDIGAIQVLPYMSKYNEQKIYEKYDFFMKCSINFEIQKK